MGEAAAAHAARNFSVTASDGSNGSTKMWISKDPVTGSTRASYDDGVAQTFDAIVVGAGPAGLSAAAELAREGRCLLLEQGPPARTRKRNSSRDLLRGVGGAGLFSDGKHSFFPSASELWRLSDRDALAAAFDATARLLAKYGVDAGAFPQELPSMPEQYQWLRKPYPSHYVPFEKRLACIDQLWRAGGETRSDACVRGA